MNIIDELKELSNTTTKGFDTKKLDRVFEEELLPKFKNYAARFKDNKIRLTKNCHDNSISNLMEELFQGKFTLQSLIETEMKPYLENKGFRVHIWDPAYSVEVSWQ